MTAANAVALAWQDAKNLDPYTAANVRYLWLGADASALDLKGAALALSIISRSATLKRPALLNGNIVRVYLPDFAPSQRDLKQWLGIWEDFQFDPAFSLILTRDTLEAASKTLLANVAVPEIDPKVDAVRLNAPHIDEATFVKLQVATRSQAPVVSLPYFLLRALTTVKDKGLYATIYGGRYYELAGVQKVKDVYDDPGDATDLDLFLERRGVGNLASGFTAKDLFNKLRSDKRAALFRSGVTGKPRRVDWFHGPDAANGQGVISVTHDLRDQDIDIGTHPVMNLLDFKAKAFEVIAEKGNGMHVYALFNDKEELLDEAAADVAEDRTIAAPNSMRLQSALSCMACHEAAAHDGWQPVTNDATRLIDAKMKLDIFADFSNTTKKKPFGVNDVLDRLKGLYSGDFQKSMTRARDDYAEAVLRAAGPWPEASASGQSGVVKAAIGYVVARTRAYQYDLVGPAQALAELGLATAKGRELEAIRNVLAPDPQAHLGGVVLEDPRLAALKEGIAIPRADWDLVRSFAAVRSQKTTKLMEGK